MPVSVCHSDGQTVLTLTSNPNSLCSPLCQLLGALLYTPSCCSPKRLLTPHRVGSQTVLGALWIITGALHIGFGLILLSTRGAQVYSLEDTYSPVWLGLFFFGFGVLSLLTERHPRPLLVLLSGILNLGGVALAFTAIVWYATDIDRPGFWSFCHEYNYDYYDTPSPTTMSPEQSSLLERCEEARDLLGALVTSTRSVLVALSALDLCLGLSSAIISFKTLRRGAGDSGAQEEAKE